MKRFTIYILVVLNPYKELNYSEITVYDYTEEKSIEVIEPEAEEKPRERFFCFLCDPPQWIEH